MKELRRERERDGRRGERKLEMTENRKVTRE